MIRFNVKTLSIFTLLAALPFSVFAHSGVGSLAGFGEGFGHPWLGPDHLLAMLAVGLWAADAKGGRRWLLPATFLAAMAGGAGLSFAGVAFGGAEAWVAFSVLALGLLLMTGQAVAALPATLAVAVFALGHGYVHAVEAGGKTDALAYAVGFLSATATLHGIGLISVLCGPRLFRTVRTVVAVASTLAGATLLAGA